MVPNELQITPEQLDVVFHVAVVVLMSAAALFFSYLHELEGYARREDGRHGRR